MAIGDNIAKITAQIATACHASKRDSQSVRLLAVSKFFPIGDIISAIQAGVSEFGENRVQEILEKFPTIKSQYPQIILHLIGPLQSNKIKKILGLVDYIHSLDRLSLAQDLAKIQNQNIKIPKILIQVNIGKEPQKSGINPQDLHDFINQCRQLQLPIVGLMCIPPVDCPVSPFFNYLRQECDKYNFPECSMGMSSDFPQAIELGATMIRVGSAIFGHR